MSEEDDLDSLQSDVTSSDDDAPTSTESDESGVEDTTVDVIITEEVSTEEYTMTSDDESGSFDSDGSAITQAEVYDNLKRIGELEDEKLAIQDELRRRTEQLRAMLKHIDRGSILYKMLVSALPGGQGFQTSSARASKAPKMAAAAKNKKAAKKKAATPAPKAPSVKKKTAKKKTAKKKARRKA